MTAPLLALEQCGVAYGTVEAVREASLSVTDNEIVTVIGANGAGKTTLLNAVMGVLPSRGAMRFGDRDIRRLDVEARVERGMCLVPEKRELFGSMSVEDNLVLGGFRVSAEKRRASLEQVFARFPRLFERRRQLAATLSGGEQQMLAIARCLMMRPKLIILDEPTEGIMPRLVSQIRREIHRINQSGVSILLVEQNVETAIKLCPRVFLMEKGIIVHSGASHDLKSQPEIVHRYLGLSH